jgi:hypothetical protein
MLKHFDDTNVYLKAISAKDIEPLAETETDEFFGSRCSDRIFSDDCRREMNDDLPF